MPSSVESPRAAGRAAALPSARRRFLRLSGGGLLSSAVASVLPGWRRALAASADRSGYKALVCVYLHGGNDGFNWFVPLSPGGYAVYAGARQGLALAHGSLLPLTGPSGSAAAGSDGHPYGIHPGCPELQALFDAGQLAVLCNAGTLIAPGTPAQIRSGAVPVPPQLFSHLDQEIQWQTGLAGPERHGWAGRIADLYHLQGYQPALALNIGVGGANALQQGRQTDLYVLGLSGAPVLDDLANPYWRAGRRAQAAARLLALDASHPSLLVSEYAAIEQRAAAKVAVVNDALSRAGDLATRFPSVPGDSELGAQLHAVARVIKAHSLIGDGRQIFFVSLNGFDTHNTQLSTQSQLLSILSRNLGAFFTALGEIGMRNQVTLFTASEFGRTLGCNGDGSDHAWGSHHVILGGAVKGGRYYGRMPHLAIGGPDDFGAGLGQMVPSTAASQYAATLAAWFGVPASSLTAVFPGLDHFAAADLGFMA